MLARIGAVAGGQEACGALARFCCAASGVSLAAPRDWRQRRGSQFLHVEAPDGRAEVAAYAFRSFGLPLAEFADCRFAVVAGCNVPSVAAGTLEGGVYREFEGPWPGRKGDALYVVSARAEGPIFISLSVITTRAEFERHRRMYIGMMESGRAHS